jgi:signal recognition particle subunit SRP54
VGLGEKLDALEVFHPDRMAGRILGMGDVLSLIERVELQVDAKKAAEAEARLREGQFNLEDFLDQMQEVKKMGPLENLLGMLPGMDQVMAQQPNLGMDEKTMGRIEAIIRSMTPQERRKPDMINGSRKRRIAAGSGTAVQDVNRLLGQFRDMQKMMRQMNAMQSSKTLRGLRKLPPGLNPMRRMKF